MIGAYAGSLFVTERLFRVLKPKLLTLPWFARIWSWFVTARDKTLAWLQSLEVPRIAGRDDALVDDNVRILPFGACIRDVGFD